MTARVFPSGALGPRFSDLWNGLRTLPAVGDLVGRVIDDRLVDVGIVVAERGANVSDVLWSFSADRHPESLTSDGAHVWDLRLCRVDGGA